jgi:hypothetical protein
MTSANEPTCPLRLPEVARPHERKGRRIRQQIGVFEGYPLARLPPL